MPVEQPTDSRQRGVALLIVLLLSVIGCLAVLGVSRLMLLNESDVGLAADEARAFAAANALLRDAETDVMGAWPDGSHCGPVDAEAGCRSRHGGGVFLPFAPGDRDLLAARLAASAGPPCRDGICLSPAPIPPAPSGPVEWPDKALLADGDPPGQPPSHARYGEFTRPAAPTLEAQQNPYLQWQGTARSRGRYWIEVLDYAVGSGSAGAGVRWQPDSTRPFVFRITAAVDGLRPDLQVVLREIFVPSPLYPPP